MLRTLDAGALRVACADDGPADGLPVVLLHGFPYDIHAFEAVCPVLVDAGCRVLRPYLRGFGPTRFRDAANPRSGQQAALAQDLVDLLDALGLGRAVLAGFDWGGRAACAVAALWPDRVHGLVSVGGYTIQDIAAAAQPLPPREEQRLWYQYYFHGERGRLGLEQHRGALCRLLWEQWSPGWRFDEATYARSAVAFDNPDFVAVTVHSYRHRFGLVAGDPAVEHLERRLAQRLPLTVPSVVLHGLEDAVTPPAGSARQEHLFGAAYERQLLAGVGHSVPMEAPEAFAQAVLRVCPGVSGPTP